MQILGSITLSGLALGAALALFFGIRGSDRIKINTRDKAGVWGLSTGTLWIAAGGTWANVANGIGSVPKTALGEGAGLGNLGLGGTALALTILTFAPKWKRLLWPALLGISAAVVYGSAGGVWVIFPNVVRMVIGKVTGGL
ncbi:hypothetical protein EYS09_22180 [Streptomyces kasugaensis]|uniref:Uncharacterized protein n=1 Tax=Streptomyces kasugaensis TaxID=1946 RepID=A0A4Q9HRD5_STRKA|nr:hypothetical protein [Streptomyces kasugaensis]TBO57522.1 hypothetical protein EYS09_22180 [Streptomyces kasugaensis]